MTVATPLTNTVRTTSTTQRDVTGLRPAFHEEVASSTPLEQLAEDDGLIRTGPIQIGVEGLEYEVLKDCHGVLSEIEPLFM